MIDGVNNHATNRILPQPGEEVARETVPPARLDMLGWIIEVTAGTVIVKCAGIVTTSMRTGQLGQVTVRRDPPSHSKGTEVLG